MNNLLDQATGGQEMGIPLTNVYAMVV